MKKLITFLTVLLSCTLLFACTPQQQTPPDDKPDVPGTTETFEYRALVRANDTIILSEVVSAIKNSSDKMLSVLNDTNTPIVGEIAFGDAERDYSAEAMDELDALVTASTYDCTSAYVIYKAKDGNVAVVWSDSLSQKLAINRFASDYSNVSVLADMTAGILASEVLDVDEYIIDATWGELKKKAPSEVVSALMSLADMYDGSAIVDWMANLWEPYICVCGNCAAEGKEIACYGGGFYYANSSRDYEGFLPDLESTYYVVNWMTRNGASTGSPSKYIPKDIQERILAFVEACHDSDGYFYHPQWGKNIATDRKGRDYSWGTSLLESFGGATKALGASFVLKTDLTRPLGTSAAEMVSCVAPVDAFDDSLVSRDAFIAWLDSTTGGDKMYENSAGAHVINAVQDRIIEAGYLEVMLDYLDEKQEKLFQEQKKAYDADPENNPAPTGLWQRTLDYNAVWGLLKFATFYKAGNREIKHAEYAMKTCVGAIMIGADEGGNYHMNDVYNQWSSASNLIENAKLHNPGILPRLYEIAHENAVEMIGKTKEKLAKFIHEDGSFGYNQGTSAPSVYSTLVSLGLPEGDVNATNLATSMYRSVFTVFGYDVIPLCDYRDGERFAATISELGSAAKQPIPRPNPIDFDENDSGYYTDLRIGSAEIVADPQNAENQVLKYVTYNGGNDGVYFNANGVTNASCFVFEADIMVQSVTTSYFMQVNLGGVYMIDMTLAGGKIKLRDNPTTSTDIHAKDLGFTAELGKWFKLRVEYYADDVMPTIKVYKDGVLTATSHNYYGSHSGKTPATRMDNVRFWAMKKSDSVMYFDNVTVWRENKTLTDSAS